jgi:hypothetical protein
MVDLDQNLSHGIRMSREMMYDELLSIREKSLNQVVPIRIIHQKLPPILRVQGILRILREREDELKMIFFKIENEQL